MKKYTIQEIEPYIIFSSVMGSHAYGTVLPTSDIDIRGIFIQPLDDILKYGYIEQVADETNDTVYYELRRYLMLAMTNNPTVLEILFAPEDCIIIIKPEWEMVRQYAKSFLTKQCKYSFAGYAIEQIKKAKGYNKKINWEESQMKRKTVLDFCYVLCNGGSKVFSEWLNDYNKYVTPDRTYKDFGLSNIDHAHDIYAMYDLSDNECYKGIVSDEDKANDVQLTSIPKGLSPAGYISFNKSGYTSHCIKYREYKEWLKNRNEDRFKLNKEHGKNYDSKNMSHCFRLLKVAIEIAETCNLTVRRSNEEIETLMKIRRGEYDFDELIKCTEELMNKLDVVYDKSLLPDKIEVEFVEQLILDVRKLNYKL